MTGSHELTTGDAIATRLRAQRDGFLADGAPDLKQRRLWLDGLAVGLRAWRGRFAQAVMEDFGHRPVAETAALEILPTLRGISYLRFVLPDFLRKQERNVPLLLQPGLAYVLYQPLGVVGIVSPWNYPLALSLMPLATALAAGNRVMLKPSELTPRTNALLAAFLGELFPPTQVSVVTGDATVGAEFSALPFDHLFFTGSPAVGRLVMRAAAESLTPVTLELGGKSPAIIAPGGMTTRAVTSIAHGKLANAGQTCIAPDYALVPEAERDRFVDLFTASYRKLYPAGPAGPDMTAIISDHHKARLLALLDDATAQGGRIVALGTDHGRRLAPRLVLDTRPGMAIMREEIFGPVLPVVTYAGLDEALAHINAGERPLALYYFGGASGRRKVLSATTSGNVTLGNTLLHYAVNDMPFGGIGESGMGAYHGLEGLQRLSHAKGVFHPAPWHPTALLRPPFGKLPRRLLKLLIGR